LSKRKGDPLKELFLKMGPSTLGRISKKDRSQGIKYTTNATDDERKKRPGGWQMDPLFKRTHQSPWWLHKKTFHPKKKFHHYQNGQHPGPKKERIEPHLKTQLWNRKTRQSPQQHRMAYLTPKWNTTISPPKQDWMSKKNPTRHLKSHNGMGNYSAAPVRLHVQSEDKNNKVELQKICLNTTRWAKTKQKKQKNSPDILHPTTPIGLWSKNKNSKVNCRSDFWTPPSLDEQNK
jgi:hypothetical protein